jgi:hypothetical protein
LSGSIHHSDLTRLHPGDLRIELSTPTRPRRRPAELYADRAYDHDKYRRAVRGRGIQPRIARRGQPHGSGLGAYR